jgi:putative transposase
MKKKRFPEGQIIAVPKGPEAGSATKKRSRKHGISEPAFYNWKAKYAAMTVLKPGGRRSWNPRTTSAISC